MQRKKNYIAWYVMIIMACATSPCLAADLKILAFDEPPSSYVDENGKLTGFSVDVVREIQHRISNDDPIELVPEIRALVTASREPNVVLLSVSRTPDRENQYHWITLLVRKPWVFYTKKNAGIVLKSISDARQLGTIGVTRGVRSAYLEKLGFKNLETVSNNWQNIKKLFAGRIQALYYEPQGMATECQRLGIPFSEFKELLITNYSGVYLVMSEGTEPDIVKNWKNAAQDMKDDGTFQRIAEKWASYISKQYDVLCNVGIDALNF